MNDANYQIWLIGRALKSVRAAGYDVVNIADLKNMPEQQLREISGIGRKTRLLIEAAREG